jgi:hypothetical protein
MLQQIGLGLALFGFGLMVGGIVLRLTWARRVRADADIWYATVAMRLPGDRPSNREPSPTGALDSMPAPSKRRFMLQ